MKPEPSFATRKIQCHNKGMALLSLVLGLAPLWWLAGFDFIIYPIVVIGACTLYPAKLVSHGRASYNFFEICVFGLIAVFSFMMLVAGLLGAEPSRVLASAYNSLLLLTGVTAYRYTRLYWEKRLQDGTSSPLFHFKSAFTGILVFSFLTFVVGLAINKLTGMTVIRWPTLFGLITPPVENLIRFSQSATLSGGDWAYADAYMQRFSILGPDAGASAVVFIFACAFLLVATRPDLVVRRNLVLAATVILVIFTYTRTLAGGFVIGTLFAISLYDRWNKKLLLGAILVLSGLVVLSLESEKLQAIGSYRADSNSLRLLSYTKAIEAVLTSNPLFGLGIKPREEALYGIPTGSHSTLVSFLTKGGLVAFFLLMYSFYIIPVFQWIRTNRLISSVLRDNKEIREEAYQFFRIQCVIWLWIVFEDCDAPALASLCMFISLGYISYFHTKCRLLAGQYMRTPSLHVQTLGA